MAIHETKRSILKTILFIDDSQSLRTTFSQILEKAGYQVVQANDGGEGLRMFQERRPDLVICDLIMPEVEGMETMQAIRNADGEAKILAISGGGRLEASDQLKVARLIGAGATLEKPFSSESLLNSVVGLIGPADPVEGTRSN